MKTHVLITLILTSLYQRRRGVLYNTATCCHYHQGHPSTHYLHIALIENWTAVTHEEIGHNAHKCTTITTYENTANVIQQFSEVKVPEAECPGVTQYSNPVI